MRALAAAPLLVLLAVLSACSSGDAVPPAPTAEAVADSAVVVARAARQDALRAAFDTLGTYAYLRQARTTQHGPDGDLVAAETRLLRHDADGLLLLRRERQGDFAFGALGRFVDREPDVTSPPDLGRHVLPEEPPYLAERNRDAFAFTLRADTVLDGRPTRVVDVHARPGEGDRQAIRSARLFVDRATDQLVALSVTRAHRSVLFSEDHRLFVQLAQTPDGAWVPRHLYADTYLRLPFQQRRHLRTASTFWNVEPLG